MDLKDFIITENGVLSDELCDAIIKKFDSDDRVLPGKTGAGIDLQTKISDDLMISGYPDWGDLDKQVFDAIQKPLDDYYSKYEGSVGIKMRDYHDTGYQVQRTKEGGFYDWHTDDVTVVSSSTITRSEEDRYYGTYSRRMITFIVYLNDDFRGGNTAFNVDNNIKKPYKIKPQKGSILMFPSNTSYLHTGLPVKSGVKYILTGWMWDRYRGGLLHPNMETGNLDNLIPKTDVRIIR